MTTSGARPSDAFGSTLTVSEYALLNGAGITPLKGVTGCGMSWFSTTPPMPEQPPKRAAWSGSAPARYAGDVVPVSDLDAAMTQARRDALLRMRADATAGGANAVVGVRRVFTGMPAPPVKQAVGGFLKRHHLVQGISPVTEQLEYQFVGTAVRDPTILASGARETTVSGAQYATLRSSGWEPAGIVGGCSHQFGANLSTSYTIGEAIGGTAIWETARTAAHAQLQSELDELGADGAIELRATTHHSCFEMPEYFLRSSGMSMTTGILVTVELLAAAIRRVGSAHEASAASPKQLVILR